MIFKLLRPKISTIICMIVTQQSIAQDILTTDQEYVQRQSFIQQTFEEYLEASRHYASSLRESGITLRTWRKKKLAEIFEERLSSLEKNLLLSNGNLIQEFNKFIKENGTQALDDVLLIRLAQLYFEKANLEHSRLKDKMDPPNYKTSILFSKLFIKNFPESPIGDKAHYLIGFSSEEMGQTDEAIKYYKKLIQSYPVSMYSDEVRWRLGELYYLAGQYVEAMEMYTELSKFKKSAYYTKALYKLSATQFVLKMYTESSSSFQKLVFEIDNNYPISTEDQAILDESLDYLATLLTNDKTIVVSKKLLPELYFRMGLMYKKKLDEKSMRIAFDYAAKQFPLARQMPDIYKELVESYESTQETEMANTYRSQFVQLLTVNQKWWAENDKYKNVLFKTQDLLEFNLLKSAEYYAEKGYRANDFNLLQTAKDRYFNFVTKYPWSSYRDYAKLELADIEYYLGYYNNASTYYFQIVNDASSATLREEAAYSLIWSEVKKVNYDLNFSVKNLNPQDIVSTKFDEQENVFLRSAVFYISKIPVSPRRNRVIYKLAEMYFEHGDYDLSAQYLNLIISDTKNSNNLTVRAYRFLMEIYNLKADWKSLLSVQELYNSAQFFADVEMFDKDQIRQKYRDKLELAYNLEFEGKDTEAIKEFTNVLIRNPKLPFVEFLNLKLLSLYIRTRQFDRAINLSDILSTGKFKTEVQYLKAQIQWQLLNYGQAANQFKDFYIKNNNHPWAEEALLNTVVLWNQMKLYDKTRELLAQIPLGRFSAYINYSYIESLLNSKKFDEVYRAVALAKKKNTFDSFRLNSYILSAQNSKDDYLGLEKNCAVIDKNSSNLKLKNAFLTLNQSHCDYVRLKSKIGQPTTTLEDLVSHLNKIYSYKVDKITLMALNEIISKSDLRNTYKTQFEQLIEKGWSLARVTPVSEQTQSLSESILNFTGKKPSSLIDFMKWNISYGDYFDFKNLEGVNEWKNTKLDCESKQYQQCVAQLEQIKKQSPSDAIFENLIIANLKSNNEMGLRQSIKDFIEFSKFSNRSQAYAYLLNEQSLIPDKNKVAEFVGEDVISVMAQTNFLYQNQGFKSAHDYILNKISSNPELPLYYIVLSKIYFEKEFYDLSRTTLLIGYSNTNSPILLPPIYQVNAVTYTTTKVAESIGNQDLSLAEHYGLAFGALKSKNLGTVEVSLAKVKNYKYWFDMIKSTQLQYSENTYAKREIAEEKK